ncbi:MAG: tRNA 2-selenouridine(34) synthase MnmH [Pseudomonadota bacterium]
MLRSDTNDYAGLFRGDIPLLDTRAPIEFARGAFPGAENLPLLNDDERAAVGTCYKERGQAAAMALGNELVSGSLREARIDGWQRFAETHPDGYLYCFRGGLRSQLVQLWLAERGVAYPRIQGGYKAMRGFLLEQLASGVARAEFILVSGATGTGKTRLIHRLPRSLDLEGMARHRGSAFGYIVDEQPSQISFENTLAISLLRLLSDSDAPIYIEDEGRLIGRLALPETLRLRMATAPLLLLEHPVEERVDVVVDDYIVDLGRRFRERYGGEGPERHRQQLLDGLARTRKRLGGERHRDIEAQMIEAFEEQARSGSTHGHRSWVHRLLTEYYDPMYDYQLSQRAGLRLFRGRRSAAERYIMERRIDA